MLVELPDGTWVRADTVLAVFVAEDESGVIVRTENGDFEIEPAEGWDAARYCRGIAIDINGALT